MKQIFFQEKLRVFVLFALTITFSLWIGSDIFLSAEGLPPFDQGYVVKDSLIEDDSRGIVFPETDHYFSDRCSRERKEEVCSAFCAEVNGQVLGETVAAEKPRVPIKKAEIKKDVTAKPVVKLVAPKGPYAPGVKFTNDRSKVSCKASGGDHKPSPNKEKNHYDEDCCIDKDEWLQPGCTYHYDDIRYSLNGKKPLPAKWKPRK